MSWTKDVDECVRVMNDAKETSFKRELAESVHSQLTGKAKGYDAPSEITDDFWRYHPGAVSESLSDRCVAKLLPLIELNHVKEAKENPKHANQPLFAFFSNPAGESYTYFQTPTTGLPFSDELKELATIAETLTGEKFTKAFGNVYLNGQDHIPPHRDTTHGKDHIVSFSFYESRPESQEYAQEVRTLVIESNSGQVVQIIMEDASAVIMKPGMQLLFKHSVPPSTAAKHRRLNITLRV